MGVRVATEQETSIGWEAGRAVRCSALAGVPETDEDEGTGAVEEAASFFSVDLTRVIASR